MISFDFDLIFDFLSLPFSPCLLASPLKIFIYFSNVFRSIPIYLTRVHETSIRQRKPPRATLVFQDRFTDIAHLRYVALQVEPLAQHDLEQLLHVD